MKIDRTILIATRRSMLARAQSQQIADALMRLTAGLVVELLPLESEGDRKIDHPLAADGGKGLFTREIEQALLSEQADLAVHSLKDLPVEPTPGLTVGAIPRRADVRDCLIAPAAATIDDLPENAILGTSSLRRAAQLKRRRPDLRIRPIRGNIETRLRKVLDTAEFDATLLAVAGLQRGGLARYADKPIDVNLVLPAAGQAALAIQCRVDDPVCESLCRTLNDEISARAVALERRLVARLQADCHSPVAALVSLDGNGRTRLHARVLDPAGRQCLEVTRQGHVDQAEQCCDEAADDLLARGARELMTESVEK